MKCQDLKTGQTVTFTNIHPDEIGKNYCRSLYLACGEPYRVGRIGKREITFTRVADGITSAQKPALVNALTEITVIN